MQKQDAISHMSLLGILVLAFWLRLWVAGFEPIFPDFDPFYHGRMAEFIHENHSIPTWDDKEMGGIPYYYPPAFHILIAGLMYIFPYSSIFIGSILNVLFGTASILLLYFFSRIFFERSAAVIACVIYATIPAIVLRTSMWARPAGLSLFLGILLIFLIFRLTSNPNRRWYIVTIASLVFYVLSHSSVIAIVFACTIAVISEEKFDVKPLLKTVIFPFVVGLLYYGRFWDYFSLSGGYTSEYMPLVFDLKGDYLGKLLFISFFIPIISLPNLVHGMLMMRQMGKGFLLTLSLIAILAPFLKVNLMLLFLFAYCIGITISLKEISKFMFKGIRLGLAIAPFLITMIIFSNLFLTTSITRNNYKSEAEVVREILVVLEIPSNEIILCNNIAAGHELAYYSDGNAFISDLTDVKVWETRFEIFRSLTNPDIKSDDAYAILKENEIRYVLSLNNQPFDFYFLDGHPALRLIDERKMGVSTGRLYEVM
jgi:hypothetical protein